MFWFISFSTRFVGSYHCLIKFKSLTHFAVKIPLAIGLWILSSDLTTLTPQHSYIIGERRVMETLKKIRWQIAYQWLTEDTALHIE